jgi:hypothetical protein
VTVRVFHSGLPSLLLETTALVREPARVLDLREFHKQLSEDTTVLVRQPFRVFDLAEFHKELAEEMSAEIEARLQRKQQLLVAGLPAEDSRVLEETRSITGLAGQMGAIGGRR